MTASPSRRKRALRFIDNGDRCTLCRYLFFKADDLVGDIIRHLKVNHRGQYVRTFPKARKHATRPYLVRQTVVYDQVVEAYNKQDAVSRFDAEEADVSVKETTAYREASRSLDR